MRTYQEILESVREGKEGKRKENLKEASKNESSMASFKFSGNKKQAEEYADEIFDFLAEEGEYVTVEEVYAEGTTIYITSHFSSSKRQWMQLVNQIESEFKKVKFMALS